MTVKPEDIPEEMWEICEGKLYDHEIADVLNAAIEAGVVSPPCYWVRTDDGKAMKTRENVPYLFPGKAW